MRKLILHTETTIDSAHQLIGFNGKCSNIHGHSWKLEVLIKGDPDQLDEVGILFDFGNVKDIKELLDHKFINDVVDFNPTAENLSVFIFNELKYDYEHLEFCVRIYETAVGKDTWCQYGDFKWE